MKLSYLKPNFSNHPLNYIFLLLIFIGSFSFVSLTQADSFFEPDNQYYSSGFKWCTNGYCSSTPARAVQLRYPSLYAYEFLPSSDPDEAIVRRFRENGTRIGETIVNKISCSSDDCFPNPNPDSNQCPTSGTPINAITNSGPVGSKYSVNGCEVVPVWTDVQCTQEWINEFPDIGCKAISRYEYSGNQMQEGEHFDEVPEDDILDSDPDLDEIGILPNTSDTIVDRQFEQWNDGSTTETVVTTSTESRGAGSVRNDTETVTTVSYSNGITKTQTVVETTITNSDGSKTVTTDKTVSFTQNPVNTITVTKPHTVNKTQGQPIQTSQNTITTNTYDSNGNLTGSSTTSGSSDDGLGDGQDGSDNDYCKENPKAAGCLEWEPDSEGGNFDLEGYDAEIEQAKQDLTNIINDIRSEIEVMFDFQGNSAALGCMDFVSFNGLSKQFCLSDYANPLGKIAAAILFLALLLALFIILR